MVWRFGTRAPLSAAVASSRGLMLRVDDVGFTLLGVDCKVQGPCTKLKFKNAEGDGDLEILFVMTGSGSSTGPCREQRTGPGKTQLKQIFGFRMLTDDKEGR